MLQLACILHVSASISTPVIHNVGLLVIFQCVIDNTDGISIGLYVLFVLMKSSLKSLVII